MRTCVAALTLLGITTVTHTARADAEEDDAGTNRAPLLVPPKLSTPVLPVYPEGKKGTGERATVSLVLAIDAEGHVIDVTVRASGGEAFDEAAVTAAKQLLFEPATKDGVPVPSRIPFRFELSEPEPELDSRRDSDRVREAPDVAPSDEPSSAKTSPPDADVEGVAEIDVTGDRRPQEPTKRTIEAKELRTMPGANGDALRAVEALPGVARAPSPGGVLIVRGGAPNDTVVQADGMWIQNAYHFGGIASIVPTDVLSKIDFYPGNFGAEYGRALGGVIDIRLRSPRRDRLGGLAQLDLLDGRLLAEGPLGPKTRFLVAARRSWVDVWLKPVLEGSGTGVRTAPVYADAQVILEHDLSKSTTARLALIGSDDRLSLLLSPGASDPGVGGSLSQRSTLGRAQLRTETRIDENTQWTNMLSYGINSDAVTFGPMLVDVNLLLGQARSELRARVIKGFSVNTGVDVVFGNYDVTLRVPPQASVDQASGSVFAAPLRNLHGDGFVVRPGVYSQFEIMPVRGLRVLPGVRFDGSSDTRKATFDPRLATRWDVLGGERRVTLKGGLGIYHQNPLNESLPPWGSSTISHPRAVQASAGIEHVFSERVDVSVEVFEKWLSDLLVTRAAESSTEGGVAVRNSGSGNAKGLEFMARLNQGSGRLSGWIAYTLSRSTRRDAPNEPEHLFQYDQTHNLTVVGSYDLGKGFTLGGRFRFTSGLPLTPYVGGVVDADAGVYAPVSGPSYSSRLPSFHRLDLRLEKAWKLGASARISAYLDVQNVTNASNPEGLSYRYDYAAHRPVSGLPILPILGLRGEL